ncbi:hypothetical protein BvCmsOUP048_00606 [Escherichia coli]|nr:Uncharacterised protein [Escherichia coli]CTY72687.1 Uncharacterised protein [Escherichia coli]CTZ22542.1 Uncharacterised protein [Escherichia coli]CTZ36865.1 Uncharacterised protein [Escherichia coli]GDL34259.1 hypothetical protein BvCmsKSP029_03379 [Escherichia coli]
MFKGDIDLFNHVIGKRILRVVVLRVRFFDDIFISFTDCHMTGILHG